VIAKEAKRTQAVQYPLMGATFQQIREKPTPMAPNDLNQQLAPKS
jgi:hypothetical protein